jgi:protein-S-isoprenylcysteine O-methyltransferase Ste14
VNEPQSPALTFNVPDPQPEPPPTRAPHFTPLERKAYFRLAVITALFGGLLLIANGHIGWPSAWGFMALFFGGFGAITADLARRDPGLLAERIRQRSQKGQPPWDIVWIWSLRGSGVLWLAGMGLERRFAPSPWSVLLQDVGALMIAVGFVLIGWTFRINTFTIPAVRMQPERGHAVVSTGPYAVVRHPFYSASLLIFFGLPLLLGSVGGFMGSAILTGLVGWRAVREEQELRSGLEGYSAYAAEVRFRLIPGLW